MRNCLRGLGARVHGVQDAACGGRDAWLVVDDCALDDPDGAQDEQDRGRNGLGWCEGCAQDGPGGHTRHSPRYQNGVAQARGCDRVSTAEPLVPCYASHAPGEDCEGLGDTEGRPQPGSDQARSLGSWSGSRETRNCAGWLLQCRTPSSSQLAPQRGLVLWRVYSIQLNKFALARHS